MSNRFDELVNKETQERMLRIGKKMQQKSLPFLRWGDVKGVSNEITFRLNGKSVLHSQWIARADETAVCYCRFSSKAEGSKLLEKSPTVVLLESDLPSRPDSHMDRNKWPKSDYGDYKKAPGNFSMKSRCSTSRPAIWRSSRRRWNGDGKPSARLSNILPARVAVQSFSSKSGKYPAVAARRFSSARLTSSPRMKATISASI